MAKSPFTPTRQQVIDVFNNSLTSEVLFTFGVRPRPNDYCNWEAINFNRIGTRTPLRLPRTTEWQSLQGQCPCRGFRLSREACPCQTPSIEHEDLMHLTYDRLRHTPATKPWPDSILATLQDPIVGFMRHVVTQGDLFPSPDLSRSWSDFILTPSPPAGK